MKMLFVCKSNVGRSQMAEVFFEKKSKNGEVKSAGCNPGKWDGKSLKETTHVTPCMDEVGIDVRKRVSKRITLEMVDWADKIVVFNSDKADWPDCLKNSKKVEVLDVEDPRHGDLDKHREIRDEIKGLVEKFVAEEQ